MLTISETEKSIPRAPTRRDDLTNLQFCVRSGQQAKEVDVVASGGNDSTQIHPVCAGLVVYAPTDPIALSSADHEFHVLVEAWRTERGATSSITKMATCPSYQRIIAMGEKAVPLMLREMEMEGDEPDQWFWALAAITGADPVPDEARGDMVAMAKAWLDWGLRRYAW